MSNRELLPGVWVWILNHNGSVIGAGKITDDEHDAGELLVEVPGIGLTRVAVRALEWHPQNNWGAE